MRENEFPSYLTAEIDPAAERNLSRYEQLTVKTYDDIAKKVEAANKRVQTAIGGGDQAAQALNRTFGAPAQRSIQQFTQASATAGVQLRRTSTDIARATAETNALAVATGRAAAGLNIVQGPLGPLAGRLSAVSRLLSQVGGLGLAGIASGAATFVFGAIANNYAQLENRLRPLYETQRDVNVAMREAIQIATSTRQAIEPVVDIYAKLTAAGREVAVSQDRIKRITETVSKATVLSGGTTQSREAGLTQFAQGFQTNLGGDELRSVRENTFRLAKAIADGLGVAVGQLKKLGSEGALTADVIATALERSAARIDAEFKKLPPTISSSLTALQNAFSITAGNIDKAVGFTSTLAQGITFVADNLQQLIGLATAVGAAWTGVRIVDVITKFTDGLRAATSVGAAFKGVQLANAQATLGNVAAMQAEVAALQQQRAQLTQNIALIQKQRAEALQAIEASRASQSAGFGRVGGASVQQSQQQANASTRALIATRRQLEATDRTLMTAEQQLAVATTASANATRIAAAQATVAATQIGLLGTVMRTTAAVARGFIAAINPIGLAVAALTYVLFEYITRQSEAEKATDAASRALENYGKIVDQTTGKLVRMSETRRKALEAETVQTAGRLSAEAQNVQSRIAAQLDASLRGVFVGPAEYRDRAKQYAEEFAAIRAGGKQAVEVYNQLRVAAANGDKIAIEFLERTKELRQESNAIAQQQKAANNTLTLVRGGTDAKVAEDQAQAEARIRAEAAGAADEFKRQTELLTARNGEQKKFIEYSEDLYEKIGAGAKDLAAAEGFLRQLRETPVRAGQEDNRANAIDDTVRRIDKIKALRAENKAAFEEAAKARVDIEFAERRTADATRDASKAERERNKELREAEVLANKVARTEDAIQRIRERYDDEPRAVDRAAQDKRTVDEIASESFAKKVLGEDPKRAADELKRAIDYGLRRPYREFIEEQQREVQIQQLILAGREGEIPLLEAKARLMDRIGNVLPEEEAALRRNLAILQEQGEAIAARDRLIDIFVEVPNEMQAAFESTWEKVRSDGIKSAKDIFGNFLDIFNRLQARIISEKIFGGLDRQLEDILRGSRTAPQAGAAGVAASAIIGSLGSGAAGGYRIPGEQDSKAVEVFRDSIGPALDDVNDALGENTEGLEKSTDVFAKVGNTIASAVATAGGVNAQGKSAKDVFNEVGDKLGGKIDKALGTDFFKGIGAEIGTAFEGASIGGFASSIADAVGIKQSKTGAQIGGAIGSFIPGVGPVIGGLIGGTIGGFFKKTAKSSAQIDIVGGEAVSGTVTGTSAKRRDAARTLSDAVAGTLNDIASQLNASLADGLDISIGTRKKKFVVDTTGRGRTKGSGTYKFEDEADAIEFALREALSRGVIKGISDASQRILKSGQDLDKALRKVSLIESVPQRLLEFTDPVAAAVTGLNKEFQELIDALIEGKASTEQFADAQKLYEFERAKAIEEATQQSISRLEEYKNSLLGGTDSPLSAAARRNNASTVLAELETKLAAGEVVDPQKLIDAAENLRTASRDLNGSRTPFFDDFNRILAAIDTAKSTQPQTPTPGDLSSLPGSPFETDANKSRIDAIMNQNNNLLGIQNQILQGGFAEMLKALGQINGGTGLYNFSAIRNLAGFASPY